MDTQENTTAKPSKAGVTDTELDQWYYMYDFQSEPTPWDEIDAVKSTTKQDQIGPIFLVDTELFWAYNSTIT